MAIDATSARPRPRAPASGGATRSLQDHVVDHGRLSTQAPAHATTPRPAVQPAVRNPALAASVVTARTIVTTTSTGNTAGANATARATAMVSIAVRRTRSR